MGYLIQSALTHVSENNINALLKTMNNLIVCLLVKKKPSPTLVIDPALASPDNNNRPREQGSFSYIGL